MSSYGSNVRIRLTLLERFLQEFYSFKLIFISCSISHPPVLSTVTEPCRDYLNSFEFKSGLLKQFFLINSDFDHCVGGRGLTRKKLVVVRFRIKFQISFPTFICGEDDGVGCTCNIQLKFLYL